MIVFQTISAISDRTTGFMGKPSIPNVSAFSSTILSLRPVQIMIGMFSLMAFNSLVPQHPQFAAGLKEISLHLRQHVLRWAKSTPKKDEAVDSIRDIGERLAQLIDKYSSP